MAGAGVRLFTAGSILTAQQVNEYLMDQAVCVFNDSASRDAAFGGVGEPALSEGRIAYLKSDDTLYLYTGSAWVEVQSGIPGTAGQVVVYDSSGDPIAQTLSGDVTINSSGVTAIGSGVIVNADINASAAIAHSKLTNITAGSVLLGNASNVPTATALSGDVTVTSSGVTAIASGVIVNADINAAAAIDKTKISGTAITAADTGTVTSTMILDGTILNADINASAGIALSKLATSTSSQLASIISDETGSGALVFGTSPTITPAAGTVTNAHDGAGYMGMPQVSVTSGGRTLAATDAGKHIYVTTNNSQAIAIPANGTTAFPIGTTIVVVVGNGITGTTVTITTDTLRLANSSSTGTRSIASNGMGTLLKINTTEWILSGNGVT